MNWIILVTAGFFEIAMTFCLGKAKTVDGLSFYWCIAGFVVSTIASMGLLAKATQTLPIGTAYAVWTGIGALGTVIIGIIVFKEPLSLLRLLFIGTLICSIIGLKVVS